jgi:hypothetical protein
MSWRRWWGWTRSTFSFFRPICKSTRYRYTFLAWIKDQNQPTNVNQICPAPHLRSQNLWWFTCPYRIYAYWKVISFSIFISDNCTKQHATEHNIVRMRQYQQQHQQQQQYQLKTFARYTAKKHTPDPSNKSKSKHSFNKHHQWNNGNNSENIVLRLSSQISKAKLICLHDW